MKSNPNSMHLPTDRKFGFFFTLVFSAFAIFFYTKKFHYAFLILGLVAIIFLITTIFKAKLLRPLNKLWMRFGILLGKIISPIILAILFFVMFAPIALGMRLFQRDELQLKSLDFESFWKPRDKDMFHKSSFTQQF